MKKFTVMILIFILNLLMVGGTQSAISNDDREWKEVGQFWFSFSNSSSIFNGTYYNGTGLNQNLPLSIALEGDGIVRKNLTFIKINLSNYVIFTLKFISIPKIGRIWSGEYFATEEEIVAIYFLINTHSDEANYSRVTLTLYDPIGKDLFSQNLDLNNNITNLESPVLLNSSGLFKARLDFIVNDSSTDNEKMWIFENVSRWLDEEDDEKYLTFALGSNSSLSFQKYYERSIAVFSLSEIIGLQQMFLAEQQAGHLSDTSKSVENIAENSTRNAIIVALIATFLGFVASLIIVVWKDKKTIKKMWKGFVSEIKLNLTIAGSIISDTQYYATITPFVFKRSAYLTLLNAGGFLNLSEDLRNRIDQVYHQMDYFNFYSGAEDPISIAEGISNSLIRIKDDVSGEISFF